MTDYSKIDKTELVWPGKKTEVERVELPFQTIEILNLPRGQRQESIFDTPAKQESFIEDKNKQQTLKGQQTSEWKNRLIWGDNFLIMGSLLKEFAGKINLIYIDPPFATGDDFSFEVQIGDQEITKEPSALEVKAYRDTWGKGMQSYLQMMYDRLILMKELLADNGTIWVHLDDHVGHYIKLMLDGLFDKNFINEIIWHYPDNFQGNVGQYANNHNFILVYGKKDGIKLERVKIKLDKPTMRDKRIWDKTKQKLTAARDEKGNIIYEEYTEKYLDDVWTIGQSSVTKAQSAEFVGYPTQKPKELLRRIILSGTKENDLVADFFCGSGTTGIVAESLDRKWIMSDLGRFAIHTSRKRLLDISAKPFLVQNLGKYERYQWAINTKYKDYIDFILELYKSEPIHGYKNVYGKKGTVFVRVGPIDAPVTLSEIQETLKEAKENNIKELHVLGWEWEMGLHDLVREEGERYGIKLSTFQIPREVLELSIKDKGIKDEIHFFELAYLDVGTKVENKKAIITLKNFIISNPELLPEEVREKIKNWSDFIDYWAIDWMFNQHPEQTEEDDIFHNMNQQYRTHKNPRLDLSMNYDYKEPGKYNVLVKVIDVFGNDTTKLVQLKI